MNVNISSSSYFQDAVSMAKPYTALVEIPMTGDSSYTVKNTIPNFIPLSIRIYNNTPANFNFYQNGFYFENLISAGQSKIVNLVGVENGSYIFFSDNPVLSGTLYVELSNFKDYPMESPIVSNIFSSPNTPLFVNVSGYSNTSSIPVAVSNTVIVEPPIGNAFLVSVQNPLNINSFAYQSYIDGISITNNTSATYSYTFYPNYNLTIFQTPNIPGISSYIIGINPNGASSTMNITSFSMLNLIGNVSYGGYSYTYMVVSQSSATSGTYFGNVIIN